jgi:hypothetical protein
MIKSIFPFGLAATKAKFGAEVKQVRLERKEAAALYHVS